jgi:organic radical activating enzyme
MNKKIKFNRVEFYITNVCNFNCDQCNRLNNYRFSGHQYWKDYCDQYKTWSEKLDINQITILGGEPLLNPDFKDWMYGIRSLWPNADIKLLTNGSRMFLNQEFDKNLYQSLIDTNIKIFINTHNRSNQNKVRSQIVDFLQQPVNQTFDGDFSKWSNAYNQVRDPSWPDCKSIDDFMNLPTHIQQECVEMHGIGPDQYLDQTAIIEFTDTNGCKILLGYYEDFVTAPLKYVGDNKFTVYNSDPERAHQVCWSKHCHHFIKGKLYKCHHVALLPEFLEQYQVDISTEDMSLLKSYQPILPETVTETVDDDLKHTIPQCKLCPENLEWVRLNSSTDKPKVKKIINIIPADS